MKLRINNFYIIFGMKFIEIISSSAVNSYKFCPRRKPTTFATLEYRGKQRLYFGLAGNPVSAYVGYHLFIHPIISSFENIEVKFEEQTVLVSYYIILVII